MTKINPAKINLLRINSTFYGRYKNLRIIAGGNPFGVYNDLIFINFHAKRLKFRNKFGKKYKPDQMMGDELMLMGNEIKYQDKKLSTLNLQH